MKSIASKQILILFITISLVVIPTCKKPPPTEDPITIKEENLIELEKKLVPDELVDVYKTKLDSKKNLPYYEEYLDSLYVASEKLYNTLNQQNELQNFKDHLNFLISEFNKKKSNNGDNFDDCELAHLGLGFAEGISLSVNATAGIAYILLAEAEYRREGGYKRVYDFVNLESQYHHFTLCNFKEPYEWEYALGGALKVGLGFTGFSEFITGLKSGKGTISQLNGPSIHKTTSLKFEPESILELFGIFVDAPLPSKVTFTNWKKRNGDCYATPERNCPEDFGNGFSGIEGISAGIGLGIGVGLSYLVALEKSEIGVCSEEILSNLIRKNYLQNKFGNGRELASKLMAIELLAKSIPGITLTSNAPRVGAATLAYLYGLGDPANCTRLNHPPAQPTNPCPSIYEKNVSLTPQLEWTCIDPDDGDELTYELYFGTSDNPPIYLYNLETPFFQITDPLESGTNYNWKVIAYDDEGNFRSGPIWHFTTLEQIMNSPPLTPSSPNPSDRATGISTTTTLTWACIDPDGDPLTYDIYFGTTSNPTTQIGRDLTTARLSRSGLSQGVTYYWKIVAKDNHSNSTTGPIWHFTTLPGSSTIPTNGLVAYYPFNGNANDMSGNNNHGTPYGVTLTEDRHGVPNSAYLFDGVDDYIQINHSQSLNLSQQISISFWARFETSGPYYFPYHIIEKFGCWGTGQRENDLNWGIETTSGFANIWSLNYSYNRIYHIVHVYDGSKILTYCDGTLRASTAANGNLIQNTNPIYISRYHHGGDYFFDGTLDDFRIYNLALTQEEITALYNE